MRIGVVILCLAAAGWGADSGVNCTFRVDPEGVLNAPARERALVAERIQRFGKRSGMLAAVAAAEVPRRNVIDSEIFDRLAAGNIPSAALTTDEEFLRRIYLDLTGRIPSSVDVRAFVADPAENKRSVVIDKLLYSPEFVDKWTMWLGDLLSNTVSTSNISRQISGRNAFHGWIKSSIASESSLQRITVEALVADGNNYESGPVNYILAGRQTMGPVQDWYDLMLYQATDRFLGVSHYDCLLCHDGRRHLDDVSLWGKSQVRLDAERLAAFFSRVNITTDGNRDSPYFNSMSVVDRVTGNYALGTTFGNRPNRLVVGTVRSLDPEYRNGAKPSGTRWRYDFASFVINDPLFAMNFANRLWKAMFNYGLVEPINALDPARLDPDNPPPAPWKLQASHPTLLRALAQALADRGFNLREFLRLIAESSAYQLSSRYDGEWNSSMTPLFARHYPRRLEGEEVHDAIVKATGIFQNYTVQGWDQPVQWAMQLPDPLEPRSNGGVANFMNAFLRGNRDTMQRNQSGSILQQLNLMNDNFVTSRNKVASSAVLRSIAQITNNDALIDELFLTFVGRRPSDYERGQAVTPLTKATTAAARNAAVEDMAWALMNKIEFIFSY